MNRVQLLGMLSMLILQMHATTIIISEIKSESRAKLTAVFPDGSTQKIAPLSTVKRPFTIIKDSEAENFDTLPILITEGSLKLFDIQFTRERKAYRSGEVVVTLNAYQNGTKLIGQKKQGYLFDRDTYTITLVIKPGKGQVIAVPEVKINASYDRPQLSEEDFESI